MPRLPAVCAECDLVYPSPLRAERADADNAFAVPVPCPACGRGGRVPAEVLRRLTEAVGVLRELELEPEELDEALASVAAVCREADSREDAVLEVLRRVPAVGRLAGLLPGEAPARMAVFTRVARALADEIRETGDAATPGGPGGAGGERPAGEPALEVVSRALAELYDREAPAGAAAPEAESRARRRLRETGRNDPCPCGSGEKYKACHWVEDQRATRD